jgi:hypothetical protein
MEDTAMSTIHTKHGDVKIYVGNAGFLWAIGHLISRTIDEADDTPKAPLKERRKLWWKESRVCIFMVVGMVIVAAGFLLLTA